MAGTAAQIELDTLEKGILQKILRSRNTGKDLQARAQIVLAAAAKLPNIQIQRDYNIEEHRVALWRNRFHETHELWKTLDPQLRPPMSDKLVRQWLADKAGRGCKPTITAEQKALIIAVACEPPSQSGYPNTHWTDRLLAQEVIRRGIVDYIAFQTVWSFLKGKRPETAQKPILPQQQGQRKGPGEI
jgi:hypothetical protein